MEEDYKDELTCPYCGTVCKDEQKDSKEPYKEEYCGNCDNQFGYEEEIFFMEDWDDFNFEEPRTVEQRRYHTYTLD